MKTKILGYRFYLLIFAAILLIIPATSQATFSIVAVDTINGIVGSAGASCIAGAQIIHDVVESVGAINTQAYYLPENQQNAHALLIAGWTPDSILNWLYYNDAGSMPTNRQYGVVTLVGPGASAAYTGSTTDNWKGHITGPGYAIQGNILLGQQIVDTMEFAYLNTEGPLEEKLMAALEAANVPGADMRCMPCDKPAISAYIKVVHPGDGATPYLYQVVNYTICAENPIDSLRILYDLWIALRYTDADVSTVTAAPTLLPANGVSEAEVTIVPLNHAGQTPTEPFVVSISNTGQSDLSEVVDNGDGTYGAIITAPLDWGKDTIKVTVTGDYGAIELNDKPLMRYYTCGDANGDGMINIFDITFMISYLYKDGPAPDPPGSADVNNDGLVNIFDITFLISFLYSGGANPFCMPWLP